MQKNVSAEKSASPDKPLWGKVSHISSGFTSVLVGYASSVVIIIQAATAAGANQAQIASWLLTLGVMVGLASVLYSLYYKMPILISWSTPGAVMLIGAASQYSLPEAIGAFIFSGFLIVLTGFITPISRLIERIPTPLSTAMLGAILMPFCIKAFTPIMDSPVIFIAMVATFFLGRRFLPRYAMLLLLVVGVGLGIFSGAFEGKNIELEVATLEWVTPQISLSAMLNLGLPLYIITMLSQNLPGFVVLKSYQYSAPPKPIFIGTGILNMFCAPFGGFSLNLAAISAAICMNEEVDEDKTQRYRAAIWAGVFYILAGLWATSVVTIFLALPSAISQILAGLALLGTLLMCLQTAFADEHYRESALFTFLVTLSGVSILGVGSTLWGLIAGLVHQRLLKKK
ncbi:MAG: benzoate/H(+) symporter BenE family transporter [Vibrio sp.]